MSAIPLDLHQNDLQGKPVHCDQYMIQFLILNTIQKVLCCFQFCLINTLFLLFQVIEPVVETLLRDAILSAIQLDPPEFLFLQKVINSRSADS